MKRSVTRLTIELTLEMFNETEDAIGVINDKGEEVWLPRKLLDNFKDHKDGACSIIVPEWLALEKELV